MNSKAKKHLRQYNFHQEQRSVDGFDEQFLSGGHFSRSDKLLGVLVVACFVGLLITVFGVSFLR